MLLLICSVVEPSQLTWETMHEVEACISANRIALSKKAAPSSPSDFY